MGKIIEGKWKNNKPIEKLSKTDDANKNKIYQIRMSLLGSRPEIWRRILVSGNTNLGKLHRIIQMLMLWDDYHLHEFIIKNVSYAHPDAEVEDSKNERRAHLYEVVTRAGTSFLYIYDFGDNWEHKITVEKILDHDERYSGRPVCIGGALSGPPEDAGGVYGYYEKLEIIKNPRHEEYEDIKEWLGDYFDPERFDIDTMNRILWSLR